MKALVKEIYRNTDKFAGQEVTVSGWVRNLRASKNFGFIELNDGSFFKSIQIVIEDNLDNFEALTKLNTAAAVTVTGKLVLTPDAKQPFEIKADSAVINGTSTPDYPSATPLNSCVLSVICARERTHSAQFSVCAP